jgi:aquaporin Z
MVAACLFATLLEHPASPARQALPDPWQRRVPMGLAMGATAVALVYSPWGRRSGAHLNPALTLTFWRLGKVAGWDAAFYVLAQFLGGLAGVGTAALVLEPWLGSPAVNYAATVPGVPGAAVAWVAEGAISFGLMLVVLTVSNSRRGGAWTGICAGLLVAVYIAAEAPLSGMSMNPARTLGSAVPGRTWTALWVYFTAPLLGMLAAAEGYRVARGSRAVRCAKLQHDTTQRCIFRCGYRLPAPVPDRPAPGSALESRR